MKSILQARIVGGEKEIEKIIEDPSWLEGFKGQFKFRSSLKSIKNSQIYQEITGVFPLDPVGSGVIAKLALL
jgi:hypothetical protein